MLPEVLAALEPRAGGIYVDGTFGAGGYSRAILDAADCRLVAIDRDPSAVARGHELAAECGERFSIVEGRFGDMDALLADRGVDAVDGVVLDIGVSSMQLDQAARGFSFRHDGPLDMRMGGPGQTAADVVNTLDETDLADLIFRYGEERRSRRIARAIVATREGTPFTRTLQLAEAVAGVVRGEPGQHPATRTFQALRIHVNDELGELSRGLLAAERLLRPAGRLVVVAFHSLEDRIVKRFLEVRTGKGAAGSRHLPMTSAPRAPSLSNARATSLPRAASRGIRAFACAILARAASTMRPRTASSA